MDITNNNALFEKFITPNLGVIKSLTKYYTRDKSIIDDNYQEILITLYKYVHTYDESRSLKTWLHIVVKHYCINVTPSLNSGISEQIVNTLEASTHINTDKDIEAFFDCLTTREKFVTLQLLKGYKPHEICKRLNVSEYALLSITRNIKWKYYVFFMPENDITDKLCSCKELRKRLEKYNSRKKTHKNADKRRSKPLLPYA